MKIRFVIIFKIKHVKCILIADDQRRTIDKAKCSIPHLAPYYTAINHAIGRFYGRGFITQSFEIMCYLTAAKIKES